MHLCLTAMSASSGVKMLSRSVAHMPIDAKPRNLHPSAMRKLFLVSLILTPLVLHGETPRMPADKELKTLVLDSLSDFDTAVQKKDFAQFYEQRLSPQFKKQFPLDKFAAAFQEFIEKGYDISNIAQSEPVFDVPPAINSDSLLVLEGHYPTKPNKVTFKLTYLNESAAWKLMGINVRATPSVENTGTIPSKKELTKLVRDSLLQFSEAIQSGDFEDFYIDTAKIWQKEASPEKLLEIFQPFVDQKVDLTPIERVEPVFDEAPAINDDGLLATKGSFPAKPSKVFFDLKFVYEDDSWKLVSINVRLAGDKAATKERKKEGDDDNE